MCVAPEIHFAAVPACAPMQTLTEYQRRQSSQRRPSESKVSRSSDWENVSDETDHLPKTPEEAFGDSTQTKSSSLPVATSTPQARLPNWRDLMGRGG